MYELNQTLIGTVWDCIQICNITENHVTSGFQVLLLRQSITFDALDCVFFVFVFEFWVYLWQGHLWDRQCRPHWSHLAWNVCVRWLWSITSLVSIQLLEFTSSQCSAIYVRLLGSTETAQRRSLVQNSVRLLLWVLETLIFKPNRVAADEKWSTISWMSSRSASVIATREALSVETHSLTNGFYVQQSSSNWLYTKMVVCWYFAFSSSFVWWEQKKLVKHDNQDRKVCQCVLERLQ